MCVNLYRLFCLDDQNPLETEQGYTFFIGLKMTKPSNNILLSNILLSHNLPMVTFYVRWHLRCWYHSKTVYTANAWSNLVIFLMPWKLNYWQIRRRRETKSIKAFKVSFPGLLQLIWLLISASL